MENIKIDEKNKIYKEVLNMVYKKYKKLGGKSKRYWEIVLGSKLNEIAELVTLRNSKLNKKREIKLRKKDKFNKYKKENERIVTLCRVRESKNREILRMIEKEKESKNKIKEMNLSIMAKDSVELLKGLVRKLKSKIQEERGGQKGDGESKIKKIQRVDSDVLIFAEKINFHAGTVPKINDACSLRVQGGMLANFSTSSASASDPKMDFERDLEGISGVVLEVLEGALGTRFAEEYLNAKKTVKHIVEQWPSVVLDSFPGDNIVQRVLVAEAVERGATLVSVQHGGWFGEVGYYGLEWIEKRISDVFATWGYESNDTELGLPAAKLMNDRRTRTSGESLLWLSRSVDHWGDYLYPATLFDLIDGVNGPHEGKDRFERAADLYDSLRQEARTDILLRFDYKYVLDEKGHMRQLKRRINKRLADATIDRGGGLEKRIQDARLILVDHVPSTVFAECIHSGVPTILFDKTDGKWLTDNARGAYRALESAGVLYQDPDAAARKIDEIYSDPVRWWESDEVTAAVDRYKNEFAYVGEQPAEEWAVFLEELDGKRAR